MADSIVTGKRWMAGIKQYVRAAKHPQTPDQIWRNLFMLDIVRSRVKGRCEVCDATISEDSVKQQEIYDQRTQKTFHVCDVCAGMHRAIYINHGLKNMNYFRNIDDAETTRK